MPAERILVVDAGTSSLRAVAVALDGAAELIASEPWQIDVPDDAAPFGREIQPEAIERSIERLIRISATHDPFAAIATTGQREGLVFAAADLSALCVSPNVDARASAEGMMLDAHWGAEIYRSTGHLPSLMQAPAKLAWLKTHRPEVAGRVGHVLPLADWIAARLTGTPAMSRSLGVENGLLDVRTGAPATHLAHAGFDQPLVKVVRDGAVIGEVASRALTGTPVVLAGADTQCALAGVGAIDAGDCGVVAGWSAPVQAVTAEPVFDAETRTWTGRHVVDDGLLVLESNAGETGRAWAWVLDLLTMTPAEADALAATAPIGSHDATIVIGARAMRASAMTAGVGGVLVPLPLVMSAPSRADIVRAVLESVAYAVRANLEQIEEVGARNVAMLRLGGGMSRSGLFAQIVADVIDRPVEVARSPETSALGAAALASVAVGLHETVDAATRAICGPRRTFEPELRASTEYEDYYAQWCAMAEAMERAAGEGV